MGKIYTQEHAEIRYRNVWHYIIETELGDIHMVQWERKDQSLDEAFMLNDNTKAVRKFKQICKDILDYKR